MIKIPDFGNNKDKTLAWVVANKNLIIQQKKAVIKFADPFGYFDINIPTNGSQFKNKASNGSISLDATSILVKAAINTTKVFDSHQDVHIDGLWNKSLKENKVNYLVKQHQFDFDGIITDEVKASAVTMSWKELNFPQYKGDTQVLLYESTIEASDSTGMFEKYIKGKVREHSVGMRYVSLALAVDSKRYPDEQKVWNKYFDIIVNQEDVNAFGYFFAVTEAKNIEGSAVVKGSNFATPTISVEESTGQPSTDTGKAKPVQSTFDVDKFLNNYQPKNFIK